MSATLEKPRPNIASEGPAGWPEWFREQQCAAQGEFDSLKPPARTDEPWRYSDLKAIDTSSFLPAEAVADPDAITLQSRGLDQAAARMVMANNRLLSLENLGLPEGVILKSLDVAAREDEALFREFFMAQPVELGSHRYAALHRAHLGTGALLYVPPGVEVALPIEIFHWVEGDRSSVFPHTLIICGENSKVTVIDSFRTADGRPAFACGVNDLHLATGARLNYIAIQDWSAQTLAFHINSTSVAKDANSTALCANFGGGFVRGESYSRMAGEGARSEMFSLNPLDGHRQIDQRTLQDHAAPRASSDLLYLNALDDSTRSIFAGLIKVQEGAHGTDAYQKVRNLILSDSSEANSMPGLEILADGVRCTHGATSGEINEEELFYFEARGIPRHIGRKLIVSGFFQTLLDRLEDEPVRNHLSRLVSAKLGVPVAE